MFANLIKTIQCKGGYMKTGEFLLYNSEDGDTKLEVRLIEETVWLNQKQMAKLFQKDIRTINEHILNIFDEGELSPEATIRNFRIVQIEGQRKIERDIVHYNLEVIISVGYRVRSHRGTQFRIWATQRLQEFLIKGFVLDDERFKRDDNNGYFDELLARIRDIRSSEKVFWRKVLDIYASSIDYDPGIETSQSFFATVQNKMHWAVHGHTAAEIIYNRSDAEQPNMGMTSWQGKKIRKAESSIAKNYLTHEELEVLNRIVNAYLEFAELQAMNRRPMHMRDWIEKLDEFLKISEREILGHAGSISHEQALQKASFEFDKYHQKLINNTSAVEKHFNESLKKIKLIKHENENNQRSKKSKITQSVLQFKIMINDIYPIIWRRIQVPDDYTFWDLHVSIQDAMGWTDSHLHQFTVANPGTGKKEYIGIPGEDMDGIFDVLPGWEIKVDEYFQLKKNKKILYLYDFGDNWEHQIEFEGTQEKQIGKYPRCLEGERACPPEDVGGTRGYENFITIVKDKKHKEHEAMLEWVGGKFDFEKFEPNKVKFDNPKRRWKLAFTEKVEF